MLLEQVLLEHYPWIHGLSRASALLLTVCIRGDSNTASTMKSYHILSVIANRPLTLCTSGHPISTRETPLIRSDSPHGVSLWRYFPIPVYCIPLSQTETPAPSLRVSCSPSPHDVTKIRLGALIAHEITKSTERPNFVSHIYCLFNDIVSLYEWRAEIHRTGR